jgi:hypothetical protein
MPTHPQGVGKVRRLPRGVARNRRTLSRRCPQKCCPAILSGVSDGTSVPNQFAMAVADKAQRAQSEPRLQWCLFVSSGDKSLKELRLFRLDSD